MRMSAWRTRYAQSSSKPAWTAPFSWDCPRHASRWHRRWSPWQPHPIKSNSSSTSAGIQPRDGRYPRRKGGRLSPLPAKQALRRSRGGNKGQFYQYPHDYPNHYVEQQYLPDALVGTVYYQFGEKEKMRMPPENTVKSCWQMSLPEKAGRQSLTI